MGVKGLQYFMDRCCPEACVTVSLREMARQHVAKGTATSSTTSPTLLVDSMACLSHWYSCRDWVCGGQWREYMTLLESWVEAFTSAGIRLVFFFDGVVEEKKRQVWVKRRRRVNGEIAKVFRHIKAHGQQPGRELYCLPPGLATFTRFALRSLGQEVLCSVQEADYEIASYGRRHGSMGILGQDSDFIIYDSVPYLSVEKLRLDSLTTVLYDRECLCRTVGLSVTQLPLLACLLGNDVVSEERMQHVQNNAMEMYRQSCPPLRAGAHQGQKVLAVAQFVSSVWGREEDEAGLIPPSLGLSAPDRELLQRGVRSYLLPGEESPQCGDVSAVSPDSACVSQGYLSPEMLKACIERHLAAEDFMVYNVVCGGVVECSNSLEDEEDTELLPQALVYKACRQHIYSLLLHRHDGSSEVEAPAVREWFVYPGNPLKEPEIVHPVPLSLSGDQPSLELLWLGSGPEVSALRLACFLSVFDCQDFSELFGAVDDCLLAALCLVTHIAIQVQDLSLEDVDAYLSQAVCLRLKRPQELQHIKLPYLCSRAVQLGSLYVRGLSHLLGANCASSCPLPSSALMPWQSFDGRLFHSKYLLAHTGTDQTVLLDGDSSCLSLFLRLREKLVESCRRRGRALQSRPRPSTSERRLKTTPGPRGGSAHAGRPVSDRGNWREREEATGEHRHDGGWRERGEMRRGPSGYEKRDKWEQRGGRGGGGRGGEMRGEQPPVFHPHPQSYTRYQDGGFQNRSRPPRQPRGRQHHSSRQTYQLAPRWSQPPAPGP